MKWEQRERDVWAPPEHLLISQWAEKYRVLGPPSQEHGPMRLRRTPYAKPVMDKCLQPNVRTVVFAKSSQVAGTEIILSVAGYFIHQDPSPVMMILADEDTAKDIADTRIKSMFRNSDALYRVVIESKFGTAEMQFTTGASLSMAWASSVARLGTRPRRVVLFDEVDKPGYYVSTKEGSPISLGTQRTQTYYDPIRWIISTPTVESGNITIYLDTADVVYDWHVPCPSCGVRQPLRFSPKYARGFEEGTYRDEHGQMRPLGMVSWEGGRHATHDQIQAARYQCGTCGALWDTIQKNQAVEAGAMVPRKEPPAVEIQVGFHINRLYSLLGKSGDIAEIVYEYLVALRSNDPRLLQGFVNGALAEPWKLTIMATTELTVLRARCDLPPQVVPEETVALTAGVDVQKSGFWFVIRAWARDYTSWLVHYGTVPLWVDIEELLFSMRFPLAGSSGRDIGIFRAGIDTGGGAQEYGQTMTEETYLWLRKNAWGRGCRVWGTKGASGELAGKISVGKPLDKTPAGQPLPGGLQIISLDTGKWKDSYHYRIGLAIERQPGGAYLHTGTDDVYAKQVTAEEKQLSLKGREEWVQKRRDNHLLDAEVMCMACADPEWPTGGIHLVRGQAGNRPAGAHGTSRDRDLERERESGGSGWLGTKKSFLRTR